MQMYSSLFMANLTMTPCISASMETVITGCIRISVIIQL